MFLNFSYFKKCSSGSRISGSQFFAGLADMMTSFTYMLANFQFAYKQQNSFLIRYDSKTLTFFSCISLQAFSPNFSSECSSGAVAYLFLELGDYSLWLVIFLVVEGECKCLCSINIEILVQELILYLKLAAANKNFSTGEDQPLQH